MLFKIIKLLARRAAAPRLYYYLLQFVHDPRRRPRSAGCPRTEVLHAFRHCVRRSEALSNMQTHVH